MLTCIAPEKIESGDLMAYVEGTAETAVVHHILHCTHCQEEVAALRKADLLLAHQLYREDCPEAMVLLEYEVGFLAEAEKTAVAAHLAICPHCTQELSMLAIEEAPAVVAAPAPTLLDKLRGVGHQILEAVRLPSTPQFDLAVRGQQEIGQIYQAGDFQLMIGQQSDGPFAEGVDVEGQVVNTITGEPIGAGLVRLQSDEHPAAETELDPFGYFEFEEMAAGDYVLHVELTAEMTTVVLVLELA